MINETLEAIKFKWSTARYKYTSSASTGIAKSAYTRQYEVGISLGNVFSNNVSIDSFEDDMTKSISLPTQAEELTFG